MNTFNQFIALVKKEYRELIRDQRSLFATFAYALFGPLLLFVVIQGIIETASEETKVVIAIQQDSQVQHAISDIQHFLTKKNVETLAYDGPIPSRLDLASSASLNFDILLRVQLPKNATLSENYLIQIYGDSSTQASVAKLTLAESLIAEFIQMKRQHAMFKQGMSPVNLPWSSHTFEVNPQTPSSSRIMDSLLIFLLLAPFFITLNYINDATAGERERGALVPFLTQPMDRQTLILSKWFVGSLLGILGTAMTIALGFELMNSLPLHEIGVQLNVTPEKILLAILILSPLAFLVASVQMWIALTAKSFKEGQSYLTLFGFLPMVAVFMATKFESLSFSPVLPLIGHQQQLQALFSDQGLDLMQLAGLSTLCLLLSAIAIKALHRQINSESILQGQ